MADANHGGTSSRLMLPQSVAPNAGSPPPRKRRRVGLVVVSAVILSAGGVVIWKAPSLTRLLTGATTVNNTTDQSGAQPSASALAQAAQSARSDSKSPSPGKSRSPLADTAREAPSLESVAADRGLLPGLNQASEVQLLAMADAADRKQDMDTALHFVANAVRHYPDSPRTRQTHVRILLHMGDAKSALRQADRYLKHDDDRELVLLRGDALASLGRIDEAIDVWTSGLSQRRIAQEAGIALNGGRDQIRRGHVAATKRLMRRASLLMPDNLEAATGVVEMMLRQDEAEPAIDWARRVVEMAPSTGLSHALLGRALLAAGKKVDALKELERSVELNPGDSPTVRLLLDLKGG